MSNKINIITDRGTRTDVWEKLWKTMANDLDYTIKTHKDAPEIKVTKETTIQVGNIKITGEQLEVCLEELLKLAKKKKPELFI